jgi:hypothetical protein
MAAMFETQSFRERLADTISRHVTANNLTEYDSTIVSYLQQKAVDNEKALMDIEHKKSASSQRGVNDALVSAITLIREASKYAIADRRKLLTKADVEAAYKAKYCQVWPFCK